MEVVPDQLLVPVALTMWIYKKKMLTLQNDPMQCCYFNTFSISKTDMTNIWKK